MNLRLILSNLYINSPFYMAFQIFQILLITALISYVLIDFHAHILNRKVLYSEIFIAFLMIVDIFWIGILSKFDFSTFMYIEMFVILLYCCLILYTQVSSYWYENEVVDFFLLVLRFMFQIIRFLFSIYSLVDTK